MKKAESTRLNILQKAFDMIYRNGYQSTSIDDIIVHTGYTKGAFFYHFKTKEEMGLAVINEVMYPGMNSMMIQPLLHSVDPVPDIYDMMKNLLMAPVPFKIEYGCPAVNLIEEMSPLNPLFKQALLRLSGEWMSAIEKSIEQGKNNGKIKPDINARQVSCFIVSGYTGIRNLGKMLGADCYRLYLRELKIYLEKMN